MTADGMDVEEAIAAAEQAVRFDQDVPPVVVQVLLAVAQRALEVSEEGVPARYHRSGDRRRDQTHAARYILGELS